MSGATAGPNRSSERDPTTNGRAERMQRVNVMGGGHSLGEVSKQSRRVDAAKPLARGHHRYADVHYSISEGHDPPVTEEWSLVHTREIKIKIHGAGATS
jgi:hypothetical protein